MIGSGAFGGPGGHHSAAGAPRELVGSFGCSPPSALMGVRATVVPECMRRGIPKQLGDGIELV